MGNMSYCRFQNTSKDFRACKEAMESIIEGGLSEEKPLTGDELFAAKRLLSDAVDFIHLFAETLDIDTGDIESLIEGNGADQVHQLMSDQEGEQP